MFPDAALATTTTQRLSAVDAFQRFHRRARLSTLLAKLKGRKIHPAELDFSKATLQKCRQYLGQQAIPVGDIGGTVGHSRGFGREFQPLDLNLLDRWCKAYIQSCTDGWPPIVVYKVGETYYVEDGHCYVSVAKYFGLLYIQAEVWEYSSNGKK